MDLRQLRYFQAVAEELSFSKAARKLRIAQPAISRVVQELERDLGTDLLWRNRRQVRLTAAGEVLLAEAHALLQRSEETRRRVQRTAAGEEGELRLGYIGPPTQGFLGRLLAEYRHRFPKVSLHLEERTPERVWEMVARGRLAAAITRPVPGEGERALSTLLLRREPLCAVLPRSHALGQRDALTWKDLRQEPLIVLARREGVGLHDEILAACRRAGFAPLLAQTPSLMGTVLTYVQAGAGIGVATDSVAAASMPADLCSRTLQPEVSVPLVMAWNPDEYSPALKAFRELVSDWLKQDLLA